MGELIDGWMDGFFSTHSNKKKEITIKEQSKPQCRHATESLSTLG